MSGLPHQQKFKSYAVEKNQTTCIKLDHNSIQEGSNKDRQDDQNRTKERQHDGDEKGQQGKKGERKKRRKQQEKDQQTHTQPPYK